MAPAILEWNSATFEGSRWGWELARREKTNVAAARVLAPAERKTFADFVVSAGGREKTFIEKEFAGDKRGEVRLAANFCLEFAQVAPLAFCARQRDMRLVGVSLGNETTRLGGCGDAFLKQKKFRRETDAG